MRALPRRARSQDRKRGFSRSSVTTAVTSRGDAGSRIADPTSAATAPTVSAASVSAAVRTEAGSPGCPRSSTSSPAGTSPCRSASASARSTTLSLTDASTATTTSRVSPLSQ
jgi:hypothetical protein